MKLVLNCVAVVAAWLPIAQQVIATLSEWVHPHVMTAGIILALLELIVAYWRARRDCTQPVPRCLLLAGIGAAVFIVGGLASLRVLHDSGYLVFATGHLARSVTDLWKHFWT